MNYLNNTAKMGKEENELHWETYDLVWCVFKQQRVFLSMR